LVELAESFAGLREWKPNLVGMVIKDNLVPWFEAAKMYQ
jgi:hypothetical protein